MKLTVKDLKKKIKKFTGKISFDWLYNKRVLVILSVVIAVVFWFYITLNVSPTEEKVFAEVPVTIDAKAIEAKGLVLLDIMDTTELGDKTYTIPVTVQGNRYSLTQMKKEDISVVAQLTNVIEDQPNNYMLSLKVTCNNNLYDVVTQSTVESITVKLDSILSKNFTIKTKSNSTATSENENYSMESPSTYIGNEKITEVTITGPQAVVSKIAGVEVFAEGEKNLKETTDFHDGKFILLDENGIQLSGSDLNYISISAIEDRYENIAISDATVTVRVPIRINAGVKVMTVFDEEKVGSNFNFSRIEKLMNISPNDTLEIKYSPGINKEDPVYDIINSLELKIGKIDLSSITPENNVYKYALTLPSGVELTGGMTGNNVEFEVEFDLDGYVSKTLQVKVGENNFRYNSTDTEMNILPSNTINVRFVGPKSEISKLTEDNISSKVTIIADTSTVTTAGTVSLPVNVHINGRTNCWAVGTDEELSLSVAVSEPKN